MYPLFVLNFTNIFMAFRMYPPLPITLRQALGPDVFKGQYPIPKDTIMTMAIGPMMR